MALLLCAATAFAQTPPYQSNIDTTATWLSSSAVTRSTGAIVLTANDGRINPYFANLAATGLLKSPAHYATVQGWIGWYMSHLNRTDRWSLGYTMYDYVVSGTSEVYASSPPDADSTDSYAATFLSLVWAYYNTGDANAQAYVRSLSLSDLDGIAQVMTKTQQGNGLTFAKPDWQFEYLMDNSEVYRGLRDAASLFQVAFNDSTKANTYNAAADRVLNGIQTSLWNASAGDFYPDINNAGNPDPAVLTTWYPDSPAQLFPVAYGVISPSDPHAISAYAKFKTAWPNWPTLSFQSLTGETYPWCVVAYAAALMGDSTSLSNVNTYINTIETDYQSNNFAGNPPTQTWSVNEAGFYIRANDLMLHPASPGGISVAAPGANAQVTSPCPFSATATGANGAAVTSMKVYLDSTATLLASYSGNGTSTLAESADFSITTAGAHTLIVTATDAGGGSYQQNVPVNVLSSSGINVVAPGDQAQIRALTPFDTSATSTTGGAITAMKVYLDGAQIGSYNGNGTTSLTVTTTYSIAAGSHLLTVNAWDANGTLYQSGRSITVLTSGGIDVTSPANGATVSSPVAYAATVTSTSGSAITAVKVYLDFGGTPVASYTGNGTTTLNVSGSFPMASGAHTIGTNAWDASGRLYQTATTITVP